MAGGAERTGRLASPPCPPAPPSNWTHRWLESAWSTGRPKWHMDAPGFAGLQVNELSTNAVQAQEERGCTVTLVHGTFAPKATWTYPDSYVANELRKQLGPDVVITRFQWSGRNSHSARVNGGIELKKHLLQLKQDHPLFLHFVVGHSHGGNVAIYAANLGARFDGIVCLATPFLSIRNRKLGPWAVVAPIYTLCVGLQMKSIFPGQLLSILGLPFTTASLFLGLICELLVFALLGVAAAKVWDVATQSAWEWSRGSEWRPISKDLPVLVVRAKADEASGGLIFAQFSCWLAGRCCTCRCLRLGRCLGRDDCGSRNHYLADSCRDSAILARLRRGPRNAKSVVRCKCRDFASGIV